MMTPLTCPPEDQRVVLYDGLCGMCDGVVQFLLRHDQRDAFRFAPQQAGIAQQILARHNLDPSTIETIRVIENLNSPQERVFTKSDAILGIAEGLGGIWKVARVARLLPRFLRDACYDLVAHNRYRIFGRRTECRVPTPEEQRKFLA